MTEPILNLVPNSSEAHDPFNLENLRLSQNFADAALVKKALLTVPVRKPNAQDFVRVHSSEHYRDNFPIVELKEEREIYIVAPALVRELLVEITPMTLFTAINRQGVLFLWPVKMPDPDGRREEWRRSQREAAELAMTRWCRITANMSLGAYEVAVAQSTMAEPDWPEESFADMVRVAFRDRLIDRPHHPVIKRLRGLS